MSEQPTIRTLTGKVMSDKRDKTRTVEVYWSRRHPLYSKVVRHRTKCQVHDPENKSQLGDWVEIRQCRPISKTKTWELVSVVETSQAV